ncbi:MAG: hypothetical protein ACRDLP_05635 [Solirubrobacteraceae bacterium]
MDTRSFLGALGVPQLAGLRVAAACRVLPSHRRPRRLSAELAPADGRLP